MLLFLGVSSSTQYGGCLLLGCLFI
jgi:hypothetical protein